MTLVPATTEDRAWALTSDKARKLMTPGTWNAITRSAYFDALWWWVGNYLPLRFDIGYARQLGYPYKNNSPFYATGASSTGILQRVSVDVTAAAGRKNGKIRFPLGNLSWPVMARGLAVFKTLPPAELAAVVREFKANVLSELKQTTKVRATRGTQAGRLRLKIDKAQRARLDQSRGAYRRGVRKGAEVYAAAHRARLKRLKFG